MSKSIKCDFCNEMTDEQFINTLYTKVKQDNAITTKHIYICEMDYEAIKEYDEETDVFYLTYDNNRYYFYNDFEAIDEYGFNTNNL